MYKHNLSQAVVAYTFDPITHFEVEVGGSVCVGGAAWCTQKEFMTAWVTQQKPSH